eukprot:1155453-Pelagomonas_calceolata.AAC.3
MPRRNTCLFLLRLTRDSTALALAGFRQAGSRDRHLLLFHGLHQAGEGDVCVKCADRGLSSKQGSKMRQSLYDA